MIKPFLLLVLAALLVNCMSFSDRSMRPVRDSISAQMPGIQLQKEMAVAMGGGMFDILDVITLNDADWSEVDHLQMAVYQINSANSAPVFSDKVFLESLQAKDASLSWERVVRIKEQDEQLWVYVGLDLERLEVLAVSVFIVERDELVLISMDGDFHELLEYAFDPVRGYRGAYYSG